MENTSDPGQVTAPKRRIRWWRIILQILLALITAGLVYAIMLPAIVAPKSKAQPTSWWRQ